MQPVSSKALNTIIYIDGLNLHYSLDNTPYKWLNVQSLTRNILTSSFHKIVKIKYFTAIPTKADSARKHHLYLQALETLQNIEIIYGKHKKRRIKGKLIKYDPTLNKEIITNKTVKIFKPEEKETDVNIASHIVYDSCKENIDCIVLLSNDTDLKTPLKFVKYRLKKKVVIITPIIRLDNPDEPIRSNKSHIELRKLSNVNLCIEEHHLKNSQFPDVVNGISKSQDWS